MFDIYGNMKEPPVSELLKVQKTGGEYDRRKKIKGLSLNRDFQYAA